MSVFFPVTRRALLKRKPSKRHSVERIISNIEYVFSTAQYEEMYEPETLTIIGQVKNEFLSYAYTNALYVGCSFEDEEMNGLLLRAGNRRYGCFHYALC